MKNPANQPTLASYLFLPRPTFHFDRFNRQGGFSSFPAQNFHRTRLLCKKVSITLSLAIIVISFVIYFPQP